jgi:hypothetical protein
VTQAGLAVNRDAIGELSVTDVLDPDPVLVGPET